MQQMAFSEEFVLQALLKVHSNLKRFKGYLIPLSLLLKFFSSKCRLLFTSAAYIQVHFRLDIFMEANVETI